jgi:nicotinamidase-related amidase
MSGTDGAEVLNVDVRYYRAFPFEDSGYVTEGRQLGPHGVCLLLCDVYGRGFDENAEPPKQPVLAGSPAHFTRHKQMICEVIAPLAANWRSAGLPVVYLENRYTNLSHEGSHVAEFWRKTSDFDIERCIRNGGGFDYSEVLAPAPSDFVVQKQLDDGFFRTELDALLKNLNVSSVLFAGFAAEACLLATVIGAFHHRYVPIVVRDACLAQEHHDTEANLDMTRWALRVIESTRGYSTTSESIQGALSAGPFFEEANR